LFGCFQVGIEKLRLHDMTCFEPLANTWLSETWPIGVSAFGDPAKCAFSKRVIQSLGGNRRSMGLVKTGCLGRIRQ
jgi:hypothetical protein